jgi:nickel-dependent lactate racemase
MKSVELAYGTTGLSIRVPESAQVLQPHSIPGLDDEAAALRNAMRHPIESAPLKKRVRPGQTVLIVHSDITRATPNDRILPVLISELEGAGIRSDDITLMNALGTHRKQTDAELRTMLGSDIVDTYRCLQHDAFDDDGLVSLGDTSRGNPVRVNRHVLDADFRVYTGFIEPHFFAGFSGGPKAVLPALAGTESVFSNHGLEMIADANSTWGVTGGNPIWEEMLEVASRTEPVFLLNVTLNAGKEITGVFAGDLLAAHRQGCAFVRENAMIEVDRLFDVVVTTNSGYPLDQNLYQTVKGMSAANRVVKEGGTILLAAACADGLPDFGCYAELLREGGSPDGVLDLLAQPGFSRHDQWQVQIQAMIQKRADVHVYSDGLSDEQIESALLTPCRSLEDLLTRVVAEKGAEASVCVIPEGPQVVASLAS